MRPTPSFNWGRAVAPARWTARVFGVVYALLFLMVNSGFGNTATQNVGWDVTYGVIAVGILVAAFWLGVGEVIGGLAGVVGAVAWYVLFGTTRGLGALAAAVPFLLVGLLFLVCGWYTLAEARHHAPGATA